MCIPCERATDGWGSPIHERDRILYYAYINKFERVDREMAKKKERAEVRVGGKRPNEGGGKSVGGGGKTAE